MARLRRALFAPVLALLAACSAQAPVPVTPPDDTGALADAAPDAAPDDTGRADVPRDRPADTAPDAGFDAGADTGVDTGVDAGAPDTGVDTGVALDAPRDTGTDAPRDTGTDAPRDTGTDAPRDTGMDAPRDTGTDVATDAPRDTGADVAGCIATERLCGTPARCVNTATDPAHCGACGARCDGVCSGGACVRVAQVVMGERHACARLTDGTVRCWGSNEYGQLGDGRSGRLVASPTPRPVPGLAGVAELAAGERHTCARLTDGTMRCWGSDSSGQLGDGATGVERTSPVAVAGLTGVTGIAAGNLFTCARRMDGTARCWGTNLNGQLGTGVVSGAQPTPAPVPGLAGVAGIAAAGSFACAWLADGTARCWGANFQAQTGTPATTPRVLSPTAVPGVAGVTAMALGSFHACARLADGTARCWGDDTSGQVGTGAASGTPRAPSVVAGVAGVAGLAAGGVHTCAWLADGTTRCWGTNRAGAQGDGTIGGARFTPTAVPGLAGVADLAAAGDHTCARLRDGSVRCWGSDAYGELGDDAFNAGHRTPEAVPGVAGVAQVAAGGAHTCVLAADGSARCWGLGNTGELGDGVTGVGRHAPVSVAGLAGATALAAGSFHTCARMADGTARCWGYDSDGQVGDGTEGGTQPTPTPVRGLAGVTSLGAGQTFTCARLTDGTARCWGSNNNGRLGIGYHDTFPHPLAARAVMGLAGAAGVGLGLFHACAWLADGAARCWGANDDGQLGDGTTTPRYVATVVPGLRDVAAVVGGYRHACALLGDGTARCWGGNSAGQCGDGTMTRNLLAPTPVVGLAGAVELAAGEFHTCARLRDGTVRCWGANDSGQCGDGTQFEPRAAPVAVVGLTDVVGLAAGSGHTCARRRDGGLRCWGSDGAGQLGLGALRTPRW